MQRSRAFWQLRRFNRIVHNWGQPNDLGIWAFDWTQPARLEGNTLVIAVAEGANMHILEKAKKEMQDAVREMDRDQRATPEYAPMSTLKIRFEPW